MKRVLRRAPPESARSQDVVSRDGRELLSHIWRPGEREAERDSAPQVLRGSQARRRASLSVRGSAPSRRPFPAASHWLTGCG